MEAFKLLHIESLAAQLQRGPRRLRLRQLLGIEFLLSVVEGDRQYPYDFVCHALTGYRPPPSKERGERLLDGELLISDLVLLAELLSDDAEMAVGAWSETVFSVRELADRFDVSTKTIFRWRRRGLSGWKMRFADRRMRLVFPERCVRRFVAANIPLVTRGSSFSQLSRGQREQVIARARELAGDEYPTVNAVARVIAGELGRAVETVRLILKHYDEAHPGTGIFNRSALRLDPDDQRLAVWEAYVDGAGVEALARRFGRSVAWVYRTVTEMRARDLHARKLEFVASEEFSGPRAESQILGPAAFPLRQALPENGRRVPAGLPPYLAQLFRIPLLTPEGERFLFRKFNYLRFKADRLRRELDAESATASELDRIDELLAAAAAVKNEIVQANLRLVVGIAKRHISATNDLFELISDGNISLMRAVDKFDYTRGFKFSTYATWAIMKNFARSVPEQRHHHERYQTGRDELLGVASSSAEEPEGGEFLLVREVVERMLATLEPRERDILRQRFGLDDRGEVRTLEQIGRRFGVSKERVRQLEARAMGKLRSDFRIEVERLVGP